MNQYSNFVDDRIVRTTIDDKKRLKRLLLHYELYQLSQLGNNIYYHYRNGFNKFRYCSEEYLNHMREFIADVEIKDKITKTNNKKGSIKIKVVNSSSSSSSSSKTKKSKKKKLW